jgi:hypothetical protein
VQVDVHGIDTDIARAHLADDGVEVGAIGIKVGSRCMHHLGYGDHVALEEPAGVGVCQHDGRHLGAQPLFHVLGIDRAIRARRHGDHAIAEQCRRRRVGAVRRFRYQHHGAFLAARLERRFDRHHAAQFPVRARLGRHGDGRHPGQLTQPARKFGDERDGARYR